MGDTFEATYEIEDGYVGKARPQHFEIQESDIEDDMGPDDLTELFFDMAREDMMQKVGAVGDPSDFIEWAQGVIAARKDA